ncbi:ribonuclease R [Phaeodactylibacter luteus]|uniref:Ribonuclease R n=1 Tax=Phaeodactylibacter luteus TaxID=1564516 RepID=A0A5C6RGL2_9BACT|nr:ribonuclease R [Phaeodactylibacter luteus]TXB61431.1 ribonuclease R [Phaeodactylibacter luteus]
MSKNRKNKSKKTGQKLSARQLRDEILKLFKRNPKKLLNPKQISRKLKIANNTDSVQDALEKLAEHKDIRPAGDYKFKLSQDASGGDRRDAKYYEGLVDMTRSGDAYIVCEGLENDVHISARFLHTAMNGDKVKIRVWTPPGRRKPEGEVEAVLERARDHFIGTLWRYPKHAVVTIDLVPPIDVEVDISGQPSASDEDRVVVRIDEWPESHRHNPKGTVTTVLGKAGSSDIEMKTILVNNGFDLEFPEDVMREAEYLPARISQEEISRRLDIRGVTTFTVDPEDAKDFDDALSIRDLENGEVEIGVHIADVTHYVKEGTPLDKEALSRSTSVYLVDRVLPMLPERLSNDLCSLRPNVDRLAFSAIFVFNKNMKIVNRWFGKTVIHSDQRFTYEQAQERLDGKGGAFAEEVQRLGKIARHLRKQRYKNGAINFETDEVKFRLDADGAPVEVYVKERKEAHMLIEDFMLLANREVASFISMKGRMEEIPYVYRIHDEPDPDKVMELSRFAREMGFDMNVSSPESIAREYNRLARETEKRPELKLLSPLAIRTMSKAAYSSENIGHYGLGFSHYTHFTSPIRRYSDVLAHRLLERNLGSENVYRTNKAYLEEQCKHISKKERNAITAERESIKYKQVEYIEKHIGEEFDGFISGIMDRGFFVELKGLIEGMVPFETLDEPFDVADSRLRMTGVYSKKEYKMGQQVRVRIARADLAKRQIEMEWVREEAVPANGGAKAGRSRSGRRKR